SFLSSAGNLDVYNHNSSSPWTYTRTAGALRCQSTGFDLTLNTNAFTMYASGGTQADQFNILSSNSNDQWYGVGENDVCNIGVGHTQGINYQQFVKGMQSVIIDDSADAVGRSVHVNTFALGYIPGDDLLGRP